MKGSRYAPNRRRFRRFIPRPRPAAPPPMVAEVPSGGTEPGSEGERAEDPGQRPRRRRPPPFFYRRRFVRGPRPPNQQHAMEVRGTGNVDRLSKGELERGERACAQSPQGNQGLGRAVDTWVLGSCCAPRSPGPLYAPRAMTGWNLKRQPRWRGTNSREMSGYPHPDSGLGTEGKTLFPGLSLSFYHPVLKVGCVCVCRSIGGVRRMGRGRAKFSDEREANDEGIWVTERLLAH